MSGRHSFSVDKVLFSFIILFLKRLAAILKKTFMRLIKKENYVKRNKIVNRLLPRDFFLINVFFNSFPIQFGKGKDIWKEVALGIIT
jgi:hypothetical protein